MISPYPTSPTSATRRLVTVIIPAYNAEAFVLDAIQSVRDQHYSPIEILLIDDGSTDHTVELVRQHAPEVCIIQQANAGASAARNTGLGNARGEFICFLDADDGWFDGKLLAQIDYLNNHPDVGIVFHEWLVWKPDLNGIFASPAQPSVPSPEQIDAEQSGWIYRKLLLECIVHTSTVMMRRNVVEKIGGFDAGLITGEDYDFWLRASRHYAIHKLVATYSYYRSNPSGLTSKPARKNNEYEVIARAVRRWGLASPDGNTVPKSVIEQRFANLAFDFGYLHYHRGSPRLARNAFLASLRHDPLRWKVLAYLVAAATRTLFDRN